MPDNCVQVVELSDVLHVVSVRVNTPLPEVQVPLKGGNAETPRVATLPVTVLVLETATPVVLCEPPHDVGGDKVEASLLRPLLPSRLRDSPCLLSARH